MRDPIWLTLAVSIRWGLSHPPGNCPWILSKTVTAILVKDLSSADRGTEPRRRSDKAVRQLRVRNKPDGRMAHRLSGPLREGLISSELT